MLDDEAERDRSLAQGLGVFFRNRLPVLGHGFQTQLCGLFNILERFLVGIAPGMTVRQGWDFRIIPVLIRLDHYCEDVGLHAFSLDVNSVFILHTVTIGRRED